MFYLLLMVGIRLLGKRQIGQMEASEFVVTMMAANLATIPMEDTELPLMSGVIPIVTLVVLELVLSWVIMKSVVLRKFLCGKPVILIDNGKLVLENLRRTRVTLDELTGHLRQKDVLDIRTVQYAILETDGNLSVFPFPKDKPASAKDAGIQAQKQLLPITIIEDGYVSKENLKKAGKDENWLARVLKNYNAQPTDALMLTVDTADQVVYIGKDQCL
ncbi:MAG: DUF421 domain-containing protein [Oscillospiraceae bacterium]|nr:DUF421 domain-containing protein [Oscillospiraceae bacterium]